MHRDIHDQEVSIEGFEIHRYDKDTSGGGVAIYVKNTLSHHGRDDIVDPNLEIVGIEITPKQANSFLVLCWYRRPTDGTDSPTFDALSRLIKRLDTEGKEMILIGDTNCDYKKPKDSDTRKLKLIYSGYQFEQLIKDFTRVSTTVSSTGETRVTKSLKDHLSSNRPTNLCNDRKLICTTTGQYQYSNRKNRT